MNVPELSRRDLEKQVRQMLDAPRKRFLLAFHGRGTDDVLHIEGKHVRVMAVRSELDLRRRMLEVPHGDYAAFLIPWRDASLPLDLQGRFARDGKIQIVGREERLYSRFNVSEIDDDVSTSPLAAYVLTHHPEESFPIPGGRLTLDALWTSYLARVWSLDGGELALDALLGWAAFDGRGPQFVATVKDRNAEPVRAALLHFLTQKLGPVAAIVWTAWEAGRGAATLELALVIGALNDSERARVWTLMTAEQVFGKPVDMAVLKRLGDTADTALRFLTRAGRGEAAVRALVLAADQRAMSSVIAGDVGGSTRLPSAWRARLDELGRALGVVATTPTPASVQAAVTASREVWRHDMARETDQLSVLRRAEMALRLASWLAVRSDRELSLSTNEYGDVESLAAWYANDGGYIDLARRFARGSNDTVFAQGVQAVVTAVDAIRLELDRRFARALPAWHRAGRRATQVVPIDQAVQRIAAGFLEGEPERRLLVILMDGMAWSQAIELLTSMGNRASVWGPLAWHGMAKHRVGEGANANPAVLTNFPTITEVSRSAFFGGKAIPPGAVTNASLDTEKWKTNRDVLKYVSGNAVPQLRLRGEGQTKDGTASPDALELVLDPSQRIVAVVINAIDMALKADRTHEVEWKLDNVKALRDLLDKATEAGRAVLLCSDHGHVSSDLMEGTGVPMREGARWRVWQNASDPLADYEVGLPAGDGVYAPRGAHGIAMIVDDAHRYGGGIGSGEHGGASLAEVVAPCILIGCADVPAAVDDKGQAVRPMVAPSWWFFDVGAAETVELEPDERAKKPRKSTKKPTAEQPQQSFTAFVPPAPEPIAIARTKTRESPLATSELFIARASDAKTRQQAIRAVEFLRARKGVAASAAFAAELGEFAARVQGVVAKLQEILNVDGYQVLRYDRQNQQVHLDLQKLAQQFDVNI